MRKELYFGWDVEAIWKDPGLSVQSRYLFLSLIMLSQKLDKIPLDGEYCYETPFSLLRNETDLSMSSLYEAIQKLEKVSYIKIHLLPGSTGHKCYHFSFVLPHRYYLES
jgi:hypothetical protein